MTSTDLYEIGRTPGRPADPRHIVNAAAAVVSDLDPAVPVDWHAMFGRGRHPRVVLARWVCWTVMHRAGMSYPEMARTFGRQWRGVVVNGRLWGGWGHSTMIDGVRELRKRMHGNSHLLWLVVQTEREARERTWRETWHKAMALREYEPKETRPEPVSVPGDDVRERRAVS